MEDIPAGPSDPEQRNIIDKLSEFVARNGQEFESLTKEKQRDNPKFAFLQGGDFYDYYKYKVDEARKRWQSQRPQKDNYYQNFDYNYQWNSGFPDHPDPSVRWDQFGGSGGMNYGPRYPIPGPGRWGGGVGGSGGSGADPNWYPQPPWSGAPFQGGGGPGMPPMYRGFGPPPMEVGPPYRGRNYGMPPYGGSGPTNPNMFPQQPGYGYQGENYDDFQRREAHYQPPSDVTGDATQPELTEADVEQSEKNLKAQYDVLMEKQKTEIGNLLDTKRMDAVKARGEELSMTLDQMNEVIQPLIEACTKENISKGKTWVIERVAASAELTELVTDYLIARCAAYNVSFDLRLHLVYLLNDLLHHCKRRGAPTHLQEALQRVVPLVFCLASELADDDKKAKLNRVLDIWESNAYLPTVVLEKMRPKGMEAFLIEWKESQEKNSQAELEEIKKTIQSQYASLEQQHKEFTDHVHRQLAASMQQQQQQQQQQQRQQQPDVSDSSSSDSHHPPYDGPRIQSGGPAYGMWNPPQASRGMHPYDMHGVEAPADGDPHHRMTPGGYFMPPHMQPPHGNNGGGGGYPAPHGGWPGEHGPPHPSHWGQPMPPVGGQSHFHPHHGGYGPPSGRRDPIESNSNVYIEGEDDETDRSDYGRPYDRGYDSQYDNYHRYDDRMRDGRGDRSYHYRSGRSSRFSSGSSRHDASRDDSEGSPPPRDRRRSSHFTGEAGGKSDAPPPTEEPVVDPKDLEPKCPPWELPAGLMHSLVRLCDFDYVPLDGSKLRLLPPKAPSDRLLSAVDAFYMPPSHDRTRDGEGWERLGLYEFYTKKEKAREYIERQKKKKKDQPHSKSSAAEGETTPGSESSSRRRRRHSGGSAATSPSGDDESQHDDEDSEHTRPFSRDVSHTSNSRPPAYHLSHITAYPTAAVGQGIRTGADALALAPPPVQCIQGQLTHNYPGYKAAPAQPVGGGIAIPPPGQGPIPPAVAGHPPNMPPGFPGPRFFQFPPPSMSQPPPGMPVPQGLIQRPTGGPGYSSRRSRFDSRRSRSKSGSESRSRSRSDSHGSRSRTGSRSRSRSRSPRSRSRSGSRPNKSPRSRSASVSSARAGEDGTSGQSRTPSHKRRRRRSRSRSGSGSPPARFTSAPGPGGLGSGSSRGSLSAARATAMAVVASLTSSNQPWASGPPDASVGAAPSFGAAYPVEGQPGSFDDNYPPGPPSGRSRFSGGPQSAASRVAEMHLLGADPPQRDFPRR